jgi:hypothetical protein
MPRGVPKNGVRMTRKRRAAEAAKNHTAISKLIEPASLVHETDEQIFEKLNDRFSILEMMTKAAVAGEARAVIVSGPAGLGKSYTVEQELAAWDPDELNHTIIKGFVRATGLYKTLYNYREAGQVIVFDDSDSIFYDDVALNLLKAVCDTTEKRRVSWLTEGVMIDEESGERLPRGFEFNGTIVFITNLDFDALIDRGHKLAPHLQALMSRAHYIDLAMKTRRDYVVRIKQVLDQGLLKKSGLTPAQERDVVDFIEANTDKLRELSLRMALKLGAIRKIGDTWMKVAKVTCCK